MTTTQPVTSRALETVAELRQLADLIENNLDALEGATLSGLLTLWHSDPTKIANIPGGWDKEYSETVMHLTRKIGSTVHVEAVYLRSQMCEAVPTGRKVTVRKIATPAVYEEVEVDEIEWRCHPVLAVGQ